MKPRTKSLLIKYGITAGVCLAMAVMYAANAYISNLDPDGQLLLTQRDQMRILCDAFSIPGMLCIFGGLLIWLGNEGSFDGIGYVLSYAFHAIMPGPQHKRESYKDYLERKHGKEPVGFGFLLVTGVVFMLISLVFLALFYM